MNNYELKLIEMRNDLEDAIDYFNNTIYPELKNKPREIDGCLKSYIEVVLKNYIIKNNDNISEVLKIVDNTLDKIIDIYFQEYGPNKNFNIERRKQYVTYILCKIINIAPYEYSHKKYKEFCNDIDQKHLWTIVSIIALKS
ncbi:MAG: hypothetical protein ACOCRK_05010, partial [bacterium]